MGKATGIAVIGAGKAGANLAEAFTVCPDTRVVRVVSRTEESARRLATLVEAEQFGTNLRATVATTVPNFVRGLVAVVTLSFSALRPALGLPGAAGVVGAVCFALALVSAWNLRETFGIDLDYVEE